MKCFLEVKLVKLTYVFSAFSEVFSGGTSKGWVADLVGFGRCMYEHIKIKEHKLRLLQKQRMEFLKIKGKK